MRVTMGFLVLAGVFVLGLALFLGFGARRFERESVAASGVVTSLVLGPYHARVEVAAADGRRFSYSESRAHAPLHVGQKVAVRYLVASPEATARVASFPGLYGTALSFAAMGLVFLVAAGLSPWLTMRFPRMLAPRLRP